MFSKELVSRAIQNGIVQFIEQEGTTVCQIGAYWFYFLPFPEDILPEQYCKQYTLDEQAEHVFQCIRNWDEFGLGQSEAYYYIAVICGR